ncbi:gamma-glutamylaminecyclotransferase isoform X2 [Rhincodon typus]|nr:gamma-glutamylaminecyclotransferase isoform X2 [Rhincodon typus]XP_048454056.1 gamma-glutamylaminecyclotransferase isoform X2 [Rhincodon typus]XP_048454057.1 gamma-glutamylaminecyclotransferase isoform X2 [Rhincodon typus]XP_048454059.1 gamma-glutamylaminecyclotransferase isoform X2 [Rhincodon typus]XP_048454060.1 gamma-glutamylaminecyclotransferase isoform X2 [Rhincodon typus]XP_048454061.1 gamma-glutamylaminecyclotransferase isoform X2 [Rhincodon typus]XP_048454062.1 gamma-glutamylaminec
MNTVFVYGTLKKGQPNHHYMIDGSKGSGMYYGKGRTQQKYPLVIAGKNNIPFLLNLPTIGHKILGEIYLVDDQLLEFLDEFENCPDVYQRNSVRVQVLEWDNKDSKPDVKPDEDGTLMCFLYNTKFYEEDWLNLPYYDDYDPFGNHEQPKYILREAR